MRVFLAGASGVIGPSLLPALTTAGHEVWAMTRTEAKADALRAAGAEPVVCDVYDEQDLTEAMAATRPEAVINHLTNLPKKIRPRGLAKAYAANNRVRAVGGPIIARAAAVAGAKRLVAQSVAFGYGPDGSELRSEGDPLWLEAPAPFGDAVRAKDAMERATLGQDGLEGVVLRFGFWYGPRTMYASDGDMADQVRKRRFPLVGAADAVYSLVHVEDVARATVLALDHGRPGTYNICDDDPAPVRRWLPEYAKALGAPEPRRVPLWLAKLLAGRAVESMATGLVGASNQKAKTELDWEPRWASWRGGFREALG